VLESEQILRLNSDGSIDASFAPATVGSPDTFPDVQQIVVQPDGRILVLGVFATFGGDDARDGIVRLMPDGTVDSSFLPVTVTSVNSGAVQADGKILIGGLFSTVNGVAKAGVARLNVDGSLDSSFQPTGFTRLSRVRSIVVQPDGLILLSGNFRIGNPSGPRMPVIRTDANGTFDSTFDSSGLVGVITTGRDLARQPDGKIVAVINNSIYRLNSNGSNDNSFRRPVLNDATVNPPTSLGTPVSVQLYSDGRMLVGGIFTDVDPAGAPNFAHFGVVRLDSAGNVDSTLVTIHRTGNEVAPSSFVRLDDGSTLVTFDSTLDPAIPYNVARLLDSGTRDPSFTLSSSDPNRFLTDFVARGIEQLPDGNLFVCGVGAGLAPAYGKVRPDGTEDTTFATNHALPAQSATVAPDGKIIVTAGKDAQSTAYGSMGRLLADGQPDTFGVPQSIRDVQVIRSGDFGPGPIREIDVGSRVVLAQPDGKVLFEYFSVDGLYHLVRLNNDSSLDNTFTEINFSPTDVSQSFPVIFDPFLGFTYQPTDGVLSASYSVLDGSLQSDSSMILVGHFDAFGGSTARGIVRLQPNGAVDPTFNAGSGAEWTTVTATSTKYPGIENIEPTPDGKFLITGNFEAYNGVAAPGIALMNADGSVDTSFVAPVHRDKRSRTESAFRAQPDGSFLLSGPYIVGNEVEPRSLIRLIDPSAPLPTPTATATPTATPTATATATATATPTATSTATPTSTPTATATATATATPTATATATPTPTASATATATPTATATATPTATPASLVGNVSTRLPVGTGDDALIEGFIVQGSAGSTKKIIVRAIGPSLSQFGIADALANPTLEIHDASGAIVATNNDWKITQTGGLITGDQFAEINASGVSPGNDLESAIIVPLAPGSYTAVVRGAGNTTGTGVVDAFDLDAGSTARLANIATRGLVQPGDKLMIAGFIVQNGPVKVVVRAIGPSLVQFWNFQRPPRHIPSVARSTRRHRPGK
jgi:uncharacterized delta-60 repeat protein